MVKDPFKISQIQTWNDDHFEVVQSPTAGKDAQTNRINCKNKL